MRSGPHKYYPELVQPYCERALAALLQWQGLETTRPCYFHNVSKDHRNFLFNLSPDFPCIRLHHAWPLPIDTPHFIVRDVLPGANEYGISHQELGTADLVLSTFGSPGF